MEPLPTRAGVDPSFVAETRFTGAIVTCLWPRDAVADVLPPAIELGRAPGAPRGRHPVVFIFGEHDRSRVFYARLALSTGVRFPELVVGVPYVQSVGGMEPAMFVPCVFSGDPVATWSGNAHYGFVKRMVPMEWLGDTFVVNDEAGGLLAHIASHPVRPWMSVRGRAPRAFAAAATVGRLPVLGHHVGGRLVVSRFEWGFAGAWMRPVRATVSIDASLARGLDGQVAEGGGAGLEVSGMAWRLSWPEDVRG
jgi:hypothetical protein